MLAVVYIYGEASMYNNMSVRVRDGRLRQMVKQGINVWSDGRWLCENGQICKQMK